MLRDKFILDLFKFQLNNTNKFKKPCACIINIRKPQSAEMRCIYPWCSPRRCLFLNADELHYVTRLLMELRYDPIWLLPNQNEERH